MSDKYTYTVTWSEDDQEFIGSCLKLPSLSWLAKTQSNALTGIRNLVTQVITDMCNNGEQTPKPIENNNSD